MKSWGTSEHVTVKPTQSLKRATTLDFSSICPIFYIPCYKLAVHLQSYNLQRKHFSKLQIFLKIKVLER